MAHLTLAKSPEGPGPRSGDVFPLIADRTVIGRDPEVVKDGTGLVLLPHHAVSRKHAEIVRTATGFSVRDLKTRSKTHVNGNSYGPEAEIPLAEGDTIRICSFVFVFHSSAPDGGAPFA